MSDVVYNPIDMDGIPWTGNASNYIQDLSVSFSGIGIDNNTDLRNGEIVLKDFIISNTGVWSFNILAVHPLTGNLFRASVTDSGRSYSYPASIQCHIYAKVSPGAEVRLSRVDVLPSAVAFAKGREAKNVSVKIPTVSPIITTAIGKKVSIEIDTQLSRYIYREADESGLLRINGVEPVNGNINILGVGQTLVNAN
jgi:hypothetical protein